MKWSGTAESDPPRRLWRFLPLLLVGLSLTLSILPLRLPPPLLLLCALMNSSAMLVDLLLLALPDSAVATAAVVGAANTISSSLLPLLGSSREGGDDPSSLELHSLSSLPMLWSLKTQLLPQVRILFLKI